MHRNGTGFLYAAILAAALSLLAARPSAAATLTVTSTADYGPGTLRAALAAAVDGDTIDFAVTGTIALTSGTLSVDKSVTIAGPGRDQLIVDAQHSDRAFLVWSGTTATIAGLTIANGSTPSWGGGVCNFGTLTLRDCALSNSAAVNGGGGVATVGGALVITHCTLSGNSSGCTEDYKGGGAVLCTAWGEDAALTIEDSLLTSNTGVFGGGVSIWVYGFPEHPAHAGVSVRNSTLRGNYTMWDEGPGGGIWVGTSGCWDLTSATATVLVENSTLSGNSSGGGGGAVANATEGGLATVTLRNTTLSGNWSPGHGGAIGNASAWGAATVTLDNCTLTGTWADAGDGGIASSVYPDFPGTAEVRLRNTILNAGASGANLVSLGGAIVSDGHNLCSDGGGGFLTATGDVTNTDPMLGGLADNGGPTWTCALLPGSPAINAAAATDSFGNLVTEDQRGVSRPQAGANDIGAFEHPGYSWSGFLQPIDPPRADGTSASIFKAGSVVPVRFALTGASAGITNLVAALSYAQVSNGVAGTQEEADSNAQATTGNQFRYDPTSGQYTYNWSTKGLSAGSYQLTVDLGDGVSRTVVISLK